MRIIAQIINPVTEISNKTERRGTAVRSPVFLLVLESPNGLLSPAELVDVASADPVELLPLAVVVIVSDDLADVCDADPDALLEAFEVGEEVPLDDAAVVDEEAESSVLDFVPKPMRLFP